MCVRVRVGGACLHLWFPYNQTWDCNELGAEIGWGLLLDTTVNLVDHGNLPLSVQSILTCFGGPGSLLVLGGFFFRKMETMTEETELLFRWFCVGGYPSQALWYTRVVTSDGTIIDGLVENDLSLVVLTALIPSQPRFAWMTRWQLVMKCQWRWHPAMSTLSQGQPYLD